MLGDIFKKISFDYECVIYKSKEIKGNNSVRWDEVLHKVMNEKF